MTAVQERRKGTDWYAIHTKARQEYVAMENLVRQSYEVFLPLIRQSRRRRGRWQAVTEPLFPGYLFSRLDLEADNIAPIRSTRGVAGLVRFGGLPCPVPADVVENLQSLQESEEGVICTATLFQPGLHLRRPTGRTGGDLPGLQRQGAGEPAPGFPRQAAAHRYLPPPDRPGWLTGDAVPP